MRTPKEPSFEERRKAAYKRVPKILQPILEVSELMSEVLDLKHNTEPHHFCSLPVIPLTEKEQENHRFEKDWTCSACGRKWHYSYLATTWHPVR